MEPLYKLGSLEKMTLYFTVIVFQGSYKILVPFNQEKQFSTETQFLLNPRQSKENDGDDYLGKSAWEADIWDLISGIYMDI